MPRRVDPALTKRAIALVKRARKQATAPDAPGLSDWEAAFLDGVEARLEEHGSAFADPDKGALAAPLSLRQGLKLKQIRRKTETGEDRPPQRQTRRGTPLARKKPWPRRPKPVTGPEEPGD